MTEGLFWYQGVRFRTGLIYKVYSFSNGRISSNNDLIICFLIY